MKKSSKFIPLLISLFLITGCNQKKDNEKSNELIEDLTYLVNSNPSEFVQENFEYFNISSCRKIPYDNDFYYTITISYSTMELNNFKVIMVPESKLSEYSNSYKQIGYDFTINLSSKTDKTNHCYMGMNLSYKLANEEESFWILTSFSNKDSKLCFKISNFE